MPELEKEIERQFIEQLCTGVSQWTYRPDITNEDQLWTNFKTILERNNKCELDDIPLTENEFAKVKNDVCHSSFYESAKWLVGENGKVQVHLMRDNKKLNLTVIDNNHIVGGTSVYEVINQYNAFKTDEEDRDRRFDVTLLINGIPVIHVELKNQSHSYIEAFNQIKKYVGEGKFTGLFSNIQMFVISNATDTKYFAPARDYELNKKFITGWVDEENKPVGNYLEFADTVLKIPTAHEMIARYTVLDNDKKRVVILRPYQIHVIQAMRNASKHGVSGYIWHTTGSGKTLTSYKATRNLLMDIPSIDKTVFLVDRKALDNQTGSDFMSYAENDSIDVDNTSNTYALIKKLTDNRRQMIVTTRQKFQNLMKRLDTESKEYKKLMHERIAFVVDECHRTIAPRTKREIENYIPNTLWYGFTGTPIFSKNPYPAEGDLPRTTAELYGECLHSYTIKNAIHDNAVLGFMIEYLRTPNDGMVENYYNSKQHMRGVLDTIVNKSANKFKLSNGAGRTYSAILTCDSIPKAQAYYKLLREIVKGEDEKVKVNEEIKRVMPDFPKFAITYSLSDNEERSKVDQDEMKESLRDYNKMYGTHFTLENIEAYNTNLQDRLARKRGCFSTRDAQLDLVIVVDRLLTGFDSPRLSTLFIDRLPMTPQDIIQALSRTNRLCDSDKEFGQIVTFQVADEWKTDIDDAIALYSKGSYSDAVIADDWDICFNLFVDGMIYIKTIAPIPASVLSLSKEEKCDFARTFGAELRLLRRLTAFTQFSWDCLENVGISKVELIEYESHYKNVLAELRAEREKKGREEVGGEIEGIDDYDLSLFDRAEVNFEYIMGLLQRYVDAIGELSEFDFKVEQLEELVNEYSKSNEKAGALLKQMLGEIASDKESFVGVNVSMKFRNMCDDVILKHAEEFAKK